MTILHVSGLVLSRNKAVGLKLILIIYLARILKSIFSDLGQLFRKIQDCEKDVGNDADTAEKEGLAPNKPPFHCYQLYLANYLI